VPPTEVVAPVATAVPATPTAAATPTLNAPPGVYVSSVRVDPPEPRAGNPITFYGSFVNTTGSNQRYRWCVEIFNPEEGLRNSIGITTCTDQDIPPGESELPTTGWNQQQIGGCVLYLAYPIWEDQARARTRFQQPAGGDIWKDFTLCP
jgi:hypothetical protein